MIIPALLLKFREGEEGELDQRMDNDYISVFAPQITELKRVYGYNTAHILPVGKLLEDQIALLKSRGATYAQAEVIQFKYQPVRIGVSPIFQRREIDDLRMFNDICVFNRYTEGRRTWIEAYRIPHRPFDSWPTSQLRFGFGLRGSLYGGGFVPPSTSS